MTGFLNADNARERLESGFWIKYRQEIMSYEQISSFIEFNFILDAKDNAKCVHCGDEFEVNKGLRFLVHHLQNNHSGYIIEKEN